MVDMKSIVANVAAERAEQLECCEPVTAGVLDAEAATDLAHVFAALSDPVRLRLLSIVAAGGEVCSCNLEGLLDKRQSTISHHTSVLQAAGLISGVRRGKWIYWRVIPDRLALVARVLSPSLDG